MLVDIHDATSQLSNLIVAAEAGDDVIIARRGKPAVRLVPVTSKKFRFGSLAHLVKSVPDFDEAMDKAELAFNMGGSVLSSVPARHSRVDLAES